MKKWTWLALFVFVLSFSSVYAQDKEKVVVRNPVFAQEGNDIAFEKHVNIVEVGNALMVGNLNLLCDLALQVAEGERVLMRPHKSGVTSQVLWKVIVGLAVEQNNKEVLVKVANIAEVKGCKELGNVVKQVQKVVEQTVVADSIIPVVLCEMTPQQYAVFHQAVVNTQVAKVIGDVKYLDQVVENVKGVVASKYVDYLKNLVEKVKVEVAVKPVVVVTPVVGVVNPLVAVCQLMEKCRNNTVPVVQEVSVPQVVVSFELKDSAFDRYVDMVAVGVALWKADVVTLTDLILQLAEGERVLMRNHKSGITAQALWKVVLRLVAEKKNAEVLARVARVAEVQANEELAAQVAVVQKLVKEVQVVPSELTVAIHEISVEELQVVQNVLAHIQLAKATMNPKVLEVCNVDVNYITSPQKRTVVKSLLEKVRNEVKGVAEKNVEVVCVPIHKLIEEVRPCVSVANTCSSASENVVQERKEKQSTEDRQVP